MQPLSAATVWVVGAVLMVTAARVCATEYHVAMNGSDANPGTRNKPLRTIGGAARRAQAGDTITVHAGTYRERVTPPRGGESDSRRIVYQAAPGEEVWIKGSEIARGWEKYRGTVWLLKLPKGYFATYNPYTDAIEGDWFTSKGRVHHTGEVYVNGKALVEAARLEEVLNPQADAEARDAEAMRYRWYTETDETGTQIYANFHEYNPNVELVEINVRESCFYPDSPGKNFITVRGFRMSHAATQWAAPTAEQIGLIGTHWSKGWLIENNIISDSKCACVTLGKDRATGHNVWSRNPNKDGATHYNEVILRALARNWRREEIGSHTVRNNVIFNCEQAGIAGSLGAIFSRITSNHIYDVWTKRQFTGAEMGGIKLHGAIDVLIEGNHIHNTGRGLWMDWMAQGTRISRNLVWDNTSDDLFVEVNHGPFIVDNNIFLSAMSVRDWSEGGAWAHNYFGGLISSRPELNRWTPYHLAHSTALAGVTLTKGGGHRFYNNIFAGGQAPGVKTPEPAITGYGLAAYDSRPFVSYAGGNVYGRGAGALGRETGAVMLNEEAKAELIREGERLYLRLAPGRRVEEAATVLVTTELLGRTDVSEVGFEDVDGSALRIDTDFRGKPRSLVKPVAGPFEMSAEAPWRVRVF
jgi:hypothetical protein